MPLIPLNHHYAMENPASVYDEEALTALELAGRTMAKVNETVVAFNQLENETNQHLAEQDASIPVQVADKVKEHIEGGTFDRQIDEHTAEVLQQMEDTKAHVTGEVNRMALELQQTENALNGRVDNLIVNSGGDSSAEVQDARNGYATLGAYLRETLGKVQMAGDYSTAWTNLNTRLKPELTVINGEQMSYGPPTAGDEFWWEPLTLLEVKGYGVPLAATGYPQYGTQTLSTFNSSKTYSRQFRCLTDGSVTFTDWVIGKKPAHSITTSGTDINKIADENRYIIGITDAVNRPFTESSGWLLDVTKYNWNWVRQDAYGLWSPSKHAYRTGRIVTNGTNFSDTLDVEWTPWRTVATMEDVENTIGMVASTLTNEGYKIVNFGDSIFGAEQGATSVSNYLGLATGAEVINLGFGGCNMTPHYQSTWAKFSMCALADAIASGDYSAQEEASGTEGKPYYFPDAVTRLKNIDFSEVDVITIGYGTNDFTGGATLENNGNRYDVNTFGGALRYSIEKILKAYPNIRIAIVAPCWRFWYDSGNNFDYDSDTHTVNGLKLHNFVDKCIEIGNEYHLPVINPYDNLGINKFNYSQWFAPNDGTHPSANGRHQLAKLMANTIRGM